MKPAIVVPASLLCAVLGWFLPSRWITSDVQPVARPAHSPPAMAANSAQDTLVARMQNAGPAMDQFQAVMSAVIGQGLGPAAAAGNLSGFPNTEAEELAVRLAGADLGAGVVDSRTFIRSLQHADTRVQASALAAYVEQDPDAALQTLFTPAGLSMAAGCNSENLLRRLAEHDPDKALALLRSARTAGMEKGWSAVLGALAKTGPANALNALQSAPLTQRRQGMEAIVSELADKDPQAALEWTKTLSPELRGLVSNGTILDKWAQKDPAGAAAIWQEAGKGVDGGYWQLARQWAVKDPVAASRWARESGQCSDPDTFIGYTVATLAERDPQRAASMLSGMKDYQRPETIQEIAESWGSRDFPAALSWARSLTNSADKDAALSAMVDSARQLPEAERRALAKEAGTQSVTGFRLLWSMDHTEALRSFAYMPPDQQSAVMEKMTDSVLSEAPAEFAQMTDTMLKNKQAGKPANTNPNDESNPSINPRLPSVWAQRDPDAAGAWVRSLSPGANQNAAASRLVSTWAHYDPQGAATWTEALPEGRAKDRALEQMAYASDGAFDPDAALRWSASIYNKDIRFDAINSRFTDWSRRAPDAARAAVEALNIDPAEKARILKSSPN